MTIRYSIDFHRAEDALREARAQLAFRDSSLDALRSEQERLEQRIKDAEYEVSLKEKQIAVLEQIVAITEVDLLTDGSFNFGVEEIREGLRA